MPENFQISDGKDEVVLSIAVISPDDAAARLQWTS